MAIAPGPNSLHNGFDLRNQRHAPMRRVSVDTPPSISTPEDSPPMSRPRPVSRKHRAGPVRLIVGTALAALATLMPVGASAAVGAPGSTGASTASTAPVGAASVPAATKVVSTYWVAASDGGVFSFGGAPFYGSTGGIHLNRPVVAITPTSPTDTHGYREVATDGGIFAFGDATFYGSTGAMRLNRPIVGMATTADGRGYTEVACSDGLQGYMIEYVIKPLSMKSVMVCSEAKGIAGGCALPGNTGKKS